MVNLLQYTTGGFSMERSNNRNNDELDRRRITATNESRNKARTIQLMREIQMVVLIQDKGLAKRLSELSTILDQNDNNSQYVSQELKKLSEDLIKLAE